MSWTAPRLMPLARYQRKIKQAGIVDRLALVHFYHGTTGKRLHRAIKQIKRDSK
jgi:hypothetical protein